MTEELWQRSACDLADGIARRMFSAREAMESVVGRIRKRNGALNAIVFDYSDEALAEASRADEEIAAGRARGPLHGVPVTIKENVDQKGKPTPNGLPAFETLIAPDDAPLVKNLRRAGAIIVGRTNTPELSMRATTDNPLHGRTHNPWHPDASPGDRRAGPAPPRPPASGRSTTATTSAARYAFRRSRAGSATVKPTPGRVPAYNPSATAERGVLAQLMSVQGAICREVRDVRLATRVMAQGDPRDPWWVPAPFDGEKPAAPIRVAVTKNPHGYPMHPEIARAVERTARYLAAAGYAVEEVEPPPITEPARAWFSVAIAEMRVMLFPLAEKHGSQTIRDLFDWYGRMSEALDATGYMMGLADRTRMTRQWSVFLETYPLIVTPFFMRPLFPWNYDAQGFDQTKDLFDAAIYSYGINYLGLPAGVVPVGLVQDLPAGVQIVGRRFREDLILDAMAVVESQVGVLTRQLWAREA